MVIFENTKHKMTAQNTQSQKSFNQNLNFCEKPSEFMEGHEKNIMKTHNPNICKTNFSVI